MPWVTVSHTQTVCLFTVQLRTVTVPNYTVKEAHRRGTRKRLFRGHILFICKTHSHKSSHLSTIHVYRAHGGESSSVNDLRSKSELYAANHSNTVQT